MQDEQDKKYKGHIIPIINQKGGVGKSTTAINLASCLAESKKRILVIDLDPQGNTSSGFGIDKTKLEKDIYNALLEDTPLEDMILETPQKNVWVIPATIQLAGAEIELVSSIARESILKRLLEPIRYRYA